jgi:hypothetical protein
VARDGERRASRAKQDRRAHTTTSLLVATSRARTLGPNRRSQDSAIETSRSSAPDLGVRPGPSGGRSLADAGCRI